MQALPTGERWLSDDEFMSKSIQQIQKERSAAALQYLEQQKRLRRLNAQLKQAQQKRRQKRIQQAQQLCDTASHHYENEWMSVPQISKIMGLPCDRIRNLVYNTDRARQRRHFFAFKKRKRTEGSK
jgi:hypothetical protein